MRSYPIDMFKKVFCNGIAHRIKDKVYAFSACLLCCRYEVTVTGNEYNLVNLLLKGYRRNIDTYSHIDSLLHQVKFKISLCQVAYSS